jgi:hypothetical protein
MPLADAGARADAAPPSVAPGFDPDTGPAAALRRDLLSAIGRRSPRPLPAPVLASRHQTVAMRDYLAWWATHPNPSGTFAARTRWLRCLPGAWLVKVMFALGYDGLVYLDGGAPVGHVFFQRRGRALHAFSTAVSPPFEGAGYSVVMMLDFVGFAAGCAGIERVRVGRGTNNVTQRFRQRLAPHAAAFGWTVEADGWIRVAPSTDGAHQP